MKHRWRKDENGKVDTWAWDTDNHNGVICDACGESLCVHCDQDYMERDDCEGEQPFIEIMKAHVNKIPPDPDTAWIPTEQFMRSVSDGACVQMDDVMKVVMWLDQNGYVSIKDIKEPSYWYRPPQEEAEQAEVVEEKEIGEK